LSSDFRSTARLTVAAERSSTVVRRASDVGCVTQQLGERTAQSNAQGAKTKNPKKLSGRSLFFSLDILIKSCYNAVVKSRGIGNSLRKIRILFVLSRKRSFKMVRKLIILLVVIFSVPAKVNAAIVEYNLSCTGSYAELQTWATDFDLGVEFYEISSIYIDWSGSTSPSEYLPRGGRPLIICESYYKAKLYELNSNTSLASASKFL